MRSPSPILKTIVIVLAVIGLLAILAIVGMVIMHSQMGGMMSGSAMQRGMASMCGTA